MWCCVYHRSTSMHQRHNPLCRQISCQVPCTPHAAIVAFIVKVLDRYSRLEAGAKVLWINNRSRGATVPQESFMEWKFAPEERRAKVPTSECFTARMSGTKVLSMDFSLPGTKVLGNEKSSSRYHNIYRYLALWSMTAAASSVVNISSVE